MDQKFEQDYQLVYDLINEPDETPEYTEEILEDLKKRAESVFGPKGLDLATIQKCYLEERIYEKLTKWVLVIDLRFKNLSKLADIKPNSLETESIDNLVPIEDLKTEKIKEWEN